MSLVSAAEDVLAWQIKHASTLPEPHRNIRLIDGRKFEFDFAWPGEKVIVEVEGGIWRRGGGAHSRPLNILRDIEKYNMAAKLGYRVFRVTPDTIKSGEALQLVIDVLRAD